MASFPRKRRPMYEQCTSLREKMGPRLRGDDARAVNNSRPLVLLARRQRDSRVNFAAAPISTKAETHVSYCGHNGNGSRLCGNDFQRFRIQFSHTLLRGNDAAEGRQQRISAKTLPTTHALPLPGEDFNQVQDLCLLHEFNRVASEAMYNRMILHAFNLVLLQVAPLKRAVSGNTTLSLVLARVITITSSA